jgi:hypothetical protein
LHRGRSSARCTTAPRAWSRWCISSAWWPWCSPRWPIHRWPSRSRWRDRSSPMSAAESTRA